MRRTLRVLYLKAGESKVPGLFFDGPPTKAQRLWSWFCRLPPWKRCVVLPASAIGGIGAYIAFCTILHVASKKYLDDEFRPGSSAGHGLRTWEDVEPELREGDILLMMGNSTMSWKICNSQFCHSFMRPAAIRYSHVALVVAPMEPPRVDKKTGAVLSPGHGALIYEVMDNTDAFISDYTTKKIKTMCPQVVEAKQRIFARDLTTGEVCYTRLGVRRLVRMDSIEDDDIGNEKAVILRRRRLARDGGGVRPALSPEQCSAMWDFIKQHEDYMMDDSVKVILAFGHPIFATTMDHRKGRKMTTCSELISKLYMTLRITDTHNVKTGATITPRAIAPYQFGNGLEDEIGLTLNYGLSSEERIPITADLLEETTSVINRSS